MKIIDFVTMFQKCCKYLFLLCYLFWKKSPTEFMLFKGDNYVNPS